MERIQESSPIFDDLNIDLFIKVLENTAFNMSLVLLDLLPVLT